MWQGPRRTCHRFSPKVQLSRVSTVPLRACSSGVAGEMTQILQPPPELNLQAGEHPVIAFMTFSQYPAYGEIVRDSSGRCSVDWSDEGRAHFQGQALHGGGC